MFIITITAGIGTYAPAGWAPYDLHGYHLGSTVFMTNQGLTYQTGEGYYAYGRNRSGNIVKRKGKCPQNRERESAENRERKVHFFATMTNEAK